MHKTKLNVKHKFAGGGGEGVEALSDYSSTSIAALLSSQSSRGPPRLAKQSSHPSSSTNTTLIVPNSARTLREARDTRRGGDERREEASNLSWLSGALASPSSSSLPFASTLPTSGTSQPQPLSDFDFTTTRSRLAFSQASIAERRHAEAVAQKEERERRERLAKATGKSVDDPSLALPFQGLELSLGLGLGGGEGESPRGTLGYNGHHKNNLSNKLQTATNSRNGILKSKTPRLPTIYRGGNNGSIGGSPTRSAMPPTPPITNHSNTNTAHSGSDHTHPTHQYTAEQHQLLMTRLLARHFRARTHSTQASVQVQRRIEGIIDVDERTIHPLDEHGKRQRRREESARTHMLLAHQKSLDSRGVVLNSDNTNANSNTDNGGNAREEPSESARRMMAMGSLGVRARLRSADSNTMITGSGGGNYLLGSNINTNNLNVSPLSGTAVGFNFKSAGGGISSVSRLAVDGAPDLSGAVLSGGTPVNSSALLATDVTTLLSGFRRNNLLKKGHDGEKVAGYKDDDDEASSVSSSSFLGKGGGGARAVPHNHSHNHPYSRRRERRKSRKQLEYEGLKAELEERRRQRRISWHQSRIEKALELGIRESDLPANDVDHCSRSPTPLSASATPSISHLTSPRPSIGGGAAANGLVMKRRESSQARNKSTSRGASHHRNEDDDDDAILKELIRRKEQEADMESDSSVSDDGDEFSSSTSSSASGSSSSASNSMTSATTGQRSGSGRSRSRRRAGSNGSSGGDRRRRHYNHNNNRALLSVDKSFKPIKADVEAKREEIREIRRAIKRHLRGIHPNKKDGRKGAEGGDGDGDRVECGEEGVRINGPPTTASSTAQYLAPPPPHRQNERRVTGTTEGSKSGGSGLINNSFTNNNNNNNAALMAIKEAKEALADVDRDYRLSAAFLRYRHIYGMEGGRKASHKRSHHTNTKEMGTNGGGSPREPASSDEFDSGRERGVSTSSSSGRLASSSSSYAAHTRSPSCSSSSSSLEESTVPTKKPRQVSSKDSNSNDGARGTTPPSSSSVLLSLPSAHAHTRQETYIPPEVLLRKYYDPREQRLYRAPIHAHAHTASSQSSAPSPPTTNNRKNSSSERHELNNKETDETKKSVSHSVADANNNNNIKLAMSSNTNTNTTCSDRSNPTVTTQTTASGGGTVAPATTATTTTTTTSATAATTASVGEDLPLPPPFDGLSVCTIADTVANECSTDVIFATESIIRTVNESLKRNRRAASFQGDVDRAKAALIKAIFWTVEAESHADRLLKGLNCIGVEAANEVALRRRETARRAEEWDQLERQLGRLKSEAVQAVKAREELARDLEMKSVVLHWVRSRADAPLKSTEKDNEKEAPFTPAHPESSTPKAQSAGTVARPLPPSPARSVGVAADSTPQRPFSGSLLALSAGRRRESSSVSPTSSTAPNRSASATLPRPNSSSITRTSPPHSSLPKTPAIPLSPTAEAPEKPARSFRPSSSSLKPPSPLATPTSRPASGAARGVGGGAATDPHSKKSSLHGGVTGAEATNGSGVDSEALVIKALTRLRQLLVGKWTVMAGSGHIHGQGTTRNPLLRRLSSTLVPADLPSSQQGGPSEGGELSTRGRGGALLLQAKIGSNPFSVAALLAKSFPTSNNKNNAASAAITSPTPAFGFTPNVAPPSQPRKEADPPAGRDIGGGGGGMGRGAAHIKAPVVAAIEAIAAELSSRQTMMAVIEEMRVGTQ